MNRATDFQIESLAECNVKYPGAISKSIVVIIESLAECNVKTDISPNSIKPGGIESLAECNVKIFDRKNRQHVY